MDDDEVPRYPASLLSNVDVGPVSPVKAARAVQGKRRAAKLICSPTKAKRLRAFDESSAVVSPSFPPAQPPISPSMSPLDANHVLPDDSLVDLGQPSYDDLNGQVDLDSTPNFDKYVDAVNFYCCGYYQISHEFFVVQGWDSHKQRAMDSWFHLHAIQVNGAIQIACSCPQGPASDCVHQAYFRNFEPEDTLMTSGDADLPRSNKEKAVLFSREPHANGQFCSRWSVASTGNSSLRGQAIVTHHGTPPHAGEWRCSKDTAGYEVCEHIQECRRQSGSPEEGNVNEDDPDGLNGDEPYFAYDTPARLAPPSVSYLPVLPPSWAELLTDPTLYPRPRPCRAGSDAHLKLAPSSSCGCTPLRTFFDPTVPTTLRTCTVYTLLASYKRTIELQSCPSCSKTRRRYIGPDLREEGLFNLNNTTLLSHELLDDYMSSYTTSETPFVSWVTTTARRYAETGDDFLGEDTFRAAWFSYASLQLFEGDMYCQTCGPSPEKVIWDGVTVAFSRKHAKSTLRPPTEPTPSSKVRPLIKNIRGQQLIPDSDLRRSIRNIVGALGAITPTQPLDAETTQTLSNILSSIQEEHPLFASVFNHLCRQDVLRTGSKPCRETRDAINQIAAEESIIQLVPPLGLQHLRFYLKTPSASRDLSYLRTMPALHFFAQKLKGVSWLDDFFRWIEQRALNVFAQLMVDKSSLPEPNLNEEIKEDWRTTGCCYSLPQIRSRPVYPNLLSERREKTTGRGDKCSKFYTQYGQRRLTGGVVAVWCTHSICYGFHFIHEAEGRNDIFSAMVTRWTKAPKVVIYDFACALGPYCMLREPRFFAETSFMIDRFHSKGHTKCSKACFVASYADCQPDIAAINSSAAECGNGGLLKIRKSVSYMTQERAILYTKVSLSIWNRMRMKKAM